MIKRIFFGKINSITMAASLVAFSSLISRLLGIFRDRILAGEFGAGPVLDVYYAAFRIPDFIFNLLILGALSAGFIPVFTSLMKDEGHDNEEAWKFVSNILNIIMVLLIVISVLGIIFAPYFIHFITPGFSPEAQKATSDLTRIMFLSPLFLGISGVVGGVLQSFKRFFIYSLSPIFYNIGIIIGALYLVDIFGIYGLAVGVVFGASMHMAIQLPSLFALGFKYSFSFNFKGEQIKKIGAMMIPRTLSLAVGQVNLLIITIIATTLLSGSLAILNFANNLQAFAIGIFGVSFAVAAFPTFSTLAFDRKKLSESFSQTVRQILFFIVPSTVLLLTLRAQIIRVTLGVGNFDWEDTVLTIDTLGFFALSLFAQALLPLLTRVFYARHDTKSPFYIGVVSFFLNVVLSFWLSDVLGVAGLALAFSISSIFNFILLWIVLRIEIGYLHEVKILVSSLKFSAAAIVAGAAIQITKISVWPFIDMSKTLGVLLQGFLAGTMGILVYILISYVLRTEELLNLGDGIKRRLWKKKETKNRVASSDQGEARGI